MNKSWISKKLIFAFNGEQGWTQNDGAYASYLQPIKETIDRQGEDFPNLFTLKERRVTVEFIGKVNANINANIKSYII